MEGEMSLYRFPAYYSPMARKPARLGIPGYTTVRAHFRSRPGEGEKKEKKNLRRRPRKKRGQVSYGGVGQI